MPASMVRLLFLLVIKILIAKTAYSQNYFPNYRSSYGLHSTDVKNVIASAPRKDGNKTEGIFQFENNDWRPRHTELQRMNQKSIFVPEVPEECESIGICDQVPNYPHEYMEYLIAQVGNMDIFNLDVLKPDLTRRLMDDDRQTKALCESNMTVMHPMAARTTNGKWVFILNRSGAPVQGFIIDLCTFGNEERCDEDAKIDGRYWLRCDQRYVDKPMWSVDEAGRMVKEFISTPSCCYCSIAPQKRFWPFH